jgi:hypothetical protein
LKPLATLALVLGTLLPTPVRADCALLADRIAAAEALDGEATAHLRLLLPHLCDFLEMELGAEAVAPLYGAASAAAFRALLGELTGRDVFDFGERMIAHFDAAAGPSGGEPEVIESERFVFVIPPGSPAAADRDLIVSGAEETWRTIAELLDLEADLERNRRLLVSQVGVGDGGAPARYPGKVLVHLHAHRGEEARVPAYSYGAASFGATAAADNGRAPPELVARIDVLYFNPFSLLVLHHEVAHTVMLLGSFDGSRLEGRTVAGKRELRRMFFAGYRKIPTFLHEAVGDYSFYYRGFHRVWPLLVGSPEELVLRLREEGGYIPLSKLLREGGRFRAAHHKAFSLQSAVFIEHLRVTRGVQPLRAWLLADDPRGDRSFRRVFGTPIETVEAEWLERLASRGPEEP